MANIIFEETAEIFNSSTIVDSYFQMTNEGLFKFEKNIINKYFSSLKM